MMRDRARRMTLRAALCALLGTAAGCDGGEAGAADSADAVVAQADTTAPGATVTAARATTPAEIYFDLTAYAWYREGRPLRHDGRNYMPQADPTRDDRRLREAGTFEGVTYYAAEDAAEPVYTLYVPVYYGYWQRFTSPPGR